MVPEEARNGGMKTNTQGEAVYWLQMALRELGYYQGAPTGQLLSGTANAVRRYQSAKGLPTSETVNRQMVEVIARDLHALHATPTPEIPVITPGPRETK